jgi:cytochrome c oxidase cbb3-type subunit 3
MMKFQWIGIRMSQIKPFDMFIVLLLTASGLLNSQALALTQPATDGEQLFEENCSVCHGSDGDGGVGVPLNLADFLSTASDDYLISTIRLGRPGRVMPSFSNFSEQQINAVIHYIRSWQPDIKAPVYAKHFIQGNKKNGETVYRTKCAECHREAGVGGKGTGVTFSRPRDTEIIAPAIGHPAFLASAPDEMIKSVVITGRRGTPMPSAKKMKLTEQQVNDVVSYLRSLADNDKLNKKTPPTQQANVSILSYESSYSLEETIENLKQAAQGYNFRYIREQTLDKNFVADDKQNNAEYLLYFCNFKFLNQVLSIDPRIGMFLPFRVTIVKHNDKVLVMTVNPDYLCAMFNNTELKQSCDYMTEKYEAILEEGTL